MTTITVSFETAKKMKKLGWKNICEFRYSKYGLTHREFKPCYNTVSLGFIRNFQAPTAEEIADAIKAPYSIQRTNKGWFCQTAKVVDGEIAHPSVRGRNLTEALAKMRMRAQENGYRSD